MLAGRPNDETDDDPDRRILRQPHAAVVGLDRADPEDGEIKAKKNQRESH